MSISKKYLGMSVILTAAGVIPAGAQLHESINVEGKYVPEIIRIDRINTFPKAMKFSLGASPLDYESGGVAAAFSPSLMTMPATGWRDTRYLAGNRGYLELGAGSWLNSTLSAGYRFVDSQNTLVGIRLQHNSTTLWKPEMCEATSDVRQYRYDESIGVYGSHVFKGYGRLDASIDYHAGIFNYYGFCPYGALEGENLDAPSQTLNDFSIKFDWHSLINSSSALRYNASARIRHFAYRALALPHEWNMEKGKGNRETNIELSGDVRMPWGNGSSVGLDADLNVLVYGGPQTVFAYSKGSGHVEQTLSRPDDYGMLTLTPYYRFTHGLLDIRLGADLDLAFNAGPDGNRYSFLHVAPDVKFALQTGQFGIFLNVLGGSSLNTLANLYQLDYYMMPALTSTRPTYTPLDATLGVNLGPFSGFSIGVEGKFRSSRNVRLGGWYQAWLNNGDRPFRDMTGASASSGGMLYSLDSGGINIHGVSLGGYISYKPSEVFSFKAQASVQPQDGEKGFFNGYDRPKITADVEAAVRPIAPLRISAGFDFRGKRAIYTRGMTELNAGAVAEEKGELCRLALPDLSLLNLAASWDFTRNFSVWLQADNILNRHDDILPMLPGQGVSVVAGLKVLF